MSSSSARSLTAKIVTLAVFLVFAFLASTAIAADKGMLAFSKLDYMAAISEWRPQAERGDASAQYNLGIMYDQGLGVIRDYQKAAYWYNKAAEQREAKAQFNLGIMYISGQGVTQDYIKAVYWLTKAAEQGNTVAQLKLKEMYSKGQGASPDNKEAAYWYVQAAEDGDAPAQCNLGSMYILGKGVPKDDTKAVYWFTKAAEQGNAEAQNNLGVSYYQGQGVTKDYKKAASWFTKAANQGNADAKRSLNNLNEYNYRVAQQAKNEAEARLAEEAKRTAIQAEEARLVAKQAEEARQTAEAREIKETKLANEARQADEYKRAEEARRVEEAIRVEELRRDEESRQIEKSRVAEESRKAYKAKNVRDRSITIACVFFIVSLLFALYRRTHNRCETPWSLRLSIFIFTSIVLFTTCCILLVLSLNTNNIVCSKYIDNANVFEFPQDYEKSDFVFAGQKEFSKYDCSDILRICSSCGNALSDYNNNYSKYIAKYYIDTKSFNQYSPRSYHLLNGYKLRAYIAIYGTSTDGNHSLSKDYFFKIIAYCKTRFDDYPFHTGLSYYNYSTPTDNLRQYLCTSDKESNDPFLSFIDNKYRTETENDALNKYNISKNMFYVFLASLIIIKSYVIFLLSQYSLRYSCDTGIKGAVVFSLLIANVIISVFFFKNIISSFQYDPSIEVVILIDTIAVCALTLLLLYVNNRVEPGIDNSLTVGSKPPSSVLANRIVTFWVTILVLTIMFASGFQGYTESGIKGLLFGIFISLLCIFGATIFLVLVVAGSSSSSSSGGYRARPNSSLRNYRLYKQYYKSKKK